MRSRNSNTKTHTHRHTTTKDDFWYMVCVVTRMHARVYWAAIILINSRQGKERKEPFIETNRISWCYGITIDMAHSMVSSILHLISWTWFCSSLPRSSPLFLLLHCRIAFSLSLSLEMRSVISRKCFPHWTKELKFYNLSIVTYQHCCYSIINCSLSFSLSISQSIL